LRRLSISSTTGARGAGFAGLTDFAAADFADAVFADAVFAAGLAVRLGRGVRAGLPEREGEAGEDSTRPRYQRPRIRPRMRTARLAACITVRKQTVNET
jgi:hypothetical protein